jgi:hypothetical protein
MRKIFQAAPIFFAMLTAVFFVISSGKPDAAQQTRAVQHQDCHPQAIRDLQRLSPRGYAIYEAMRDKGQFFGWLSCDDVQLGLATAVHESVHNLTEERDAFPLVAGGNIRRPHQVSKFFAPSEIVKDLPATLPTSDIFVHDYLRPGSVTSASDFLYLLDELNAFSHDLNTAIALNSLRKDDRQVDHRDGLAAMMAFVTTYVDVARKSQQTTWQGLQRSEPKKVIQTLWAQAETVMASSCGIPDFGSKDRIYLRLVCEPAKSEALAQLLGRAPACPRACLS